ncbi:Multi-sensor signal transduction histidine kinase [Desulfamplus magnetovallimortis]|uniref:histidine kinase n=1 Tax=Desulfamplus magnetovallimortis TaxID=1246637 RepID=A0A1W1HDC7_9BACT|nr:ATP-binding protein [Desulfamplus magnetovallimortis]SLM30497.1 Multi-sensor signal transduction histidine kinase [Desulfamplus magnetovallimortis]
MAEKILLIDNSESHARALKLYLERSRLSVLIASSSGEMEKQFEKRDFDILLVDPFFQGGDISAVIEKFKAVNPMVQVIVFCEKKHIDKAMDNLGSVAINFLERPVNSKALDLAVVHAKRCISNERRLANYSQRLSDLQNAQALYHQLFNESPCYISVQNRDLRITAANTLFQRDFGKQIGGHCYEIYKHRESPCPDCPVVQTFEDGKSRNTEEIVTSISGKQYNVLTQTAPIIDDNGEITQVMEMSTNITQIRQLQDHLSSLGLMLGSMSHGVKGMLTALDGGIYQMESGMKKNDPERTEKAFELIKQMADRIKKMVLEILYYAKSRELQYESVGSVEMFNTVISTITNLAANNNVAIKTQIPQNLGEIEIDPNWVQSALVNLAENAVDACRYDNDKDKDSHQVEFSMWEEKDAAGEKICISICDNGMGMDQETREKMFTLFFTSKGSQGTGLGLFIANRVIKQHGGSISVKSSPGKGTCFELWLPRKRSDVSMVEKSIESLHKTKNCSTEGVMIKETIMDSGLNDASYH